jgi:hypothetical protein
MFRGHHAPCRPLNGDAQAAVSMISLRTRRPASSSLKGTVETGLWLLQPIVASVAA